MKIVFIGNLEFSARALDVLVSEKVDLAGVITRRTPELNADFFDLGPFCASRGIPCRYVNDINAPETISVIKAMKPDIIFCLGWSSLLKKDLLMIPPFGVVGFHPAELPKNRGRHPLIWALVLGLQNTASTFFIMDEGADSGDIVSQVRMPITYEDTARTLYDKVSAVALGQLITLYNDFKKGRVVTTSQNHSDSTYWRKRTKDDGRIDFRMSSRSVYNLVRGLTKPYVGAHVIYMGEPVKIWKSEERIVAIPNVEPGRVLGIENSSVLVKCWDGAVLLTEHEFKDIPKIGEYIL